MKTKFSVNSDGTVTIQYQRKIDHDICVRTFMAQPERGYVREQFGSDWHQTCYKMMPYGATLTCDKRADLIDVIRREYRAMRRAELRTMRDLGIA